MKKLLLMFFTITMITAISGCSLIAKEVDYQKIADDLNKKNMDAILYAVNGYANYDQTSFIVTTYKVNGKKREETNRISISGIYNTNDNTAVGTGQKSYEMIDNPNTSKGKKVKDNKQPSFNLKYLNNQYIDIKTKKPVDIQFIFDKLQGIEKLKPDHYTYGLDEPPFVNYDLNEKEFNEIVNDDLKIKYDKFKGASILISLNEDKSKLYIDTISLGADWEQDINNKQVEYSLVNEIYPSQDNKKAFKEFKLKEEKAFGN
ncbi:DUF3952 domain-containing protein [Heyndrickxia faecalis]|uniref:DUF3952 domain-containing protein n=1 Tax=Heyndrickxia faecalis TaxID=2824910 RepID=UPI0035984948